MFTCCCEGFIIKFLLFNTWLVNFGGLPEQHVHVMLPSKAFQFWTVLLECIYIILNCTIRINVLLEYMGKF